MMHKRRPIVIILAVWLGLFMAVLVPWHAYSHCHLGSHSGSANGFEGPHGSPGNQIDLCSICKAQSHLTLVFEQPSTAAIHENPISIQSVEPAYTPSLIPASLSPRSPPLS